MANMDAPVPHPAAAPSAATLAASLLQHAGWARALARRLVHDEAQADDVVQRAWLAALQRAPQQAERARAWLGRVVRNLAWKERRSAVRRAAREAAVAPPLASGRGDSAGEPPDSPPAIVAELEAQRLVVDALLALPDPYRETLVRRWYRDERPAAIAEAMAVPVRTVETRLARGLERLRAELTARRGAPRQWALLLLPLAGPLPLAVGGATAVGAATGAAAGSVLGSFATGAWLMSATMKAWSGAALLLAAAAAWWAWPDAMPSGDAPPSLAARGTTGAAADAIALPAARDAQAPPRDPDDSRAAAAGDAAPDAQLAVRLVERDGTPIPDFFGVWIEAESEPIELRSIADGIATLPAPARDGELLLASPRHAVTRVTVAAGTRTLDVLVAHETVLHGRFHCDGAPPGEPLVARYQVTTPLARCRAAPAMRRAQAQLDRFAEPSLWIAVDRLGQFEVRGLDPDSRGELEAPRGYSFTPIEVESDGELRATTLRPLDARDDGERIELFALPTLRARIVDESGAPSRFGRAWLEGDTERGSFRLQETYHDGELRFAVAQSQARDLVLTVRCEEGPNRQRFVRLPLEGPIVGRRHLGTLVVAPPPAWRYRLRDRAGAPIAGATFAAARDGEVLEGADRRSEPEGELDSIDPSADELLVTAAGFEPLCVALAGRDPALPLDLELERTLTLTVAIEPLPGVAPAAPWSVALVANPTPFTESALRALAHGLGLRHASLVDFELGADGLRLQLHPLDDRPFELSGWRAGAPFDLLLLDPLGLECGALRGVTVDEARTGVTLKQALPLRPFAAEVVDEAGQPIANATLELRHPATADRAACTSVSDGDGRARCPPIAADRVDVSIDAAGFVSRTWREVASAPDGAPLRFTLERALTLEIELVTADGTPLANALREEVEAWVMPRDAAPGSGRPGGLAPGDDAVHVAELTAERALVVRGVPRAPATIHLRFAGSEQTQPFEPTRPRARFTLPATGAVVVRYDLPLPEAERSGRPLLALSLEPVPAGELASRAGGVVTERVLRFDPPRRAGTLTFPAVVPGRYRLVLHWGRGNEELPIDALEREPTAVEIDVVAGESTAATLAR